MAFIRLFLGTNIVIQTCLLLWLTSGYVEGLSCIDCADVVFNGSIVGKAIQTVIDVIPGIRTKNCRTATEESGISVSTCPSNPSDQPDKVYKCGSYLGKVAVSVPILGDLPVHVVDRECLLVYRGLKTGCHSTDNVQKDAATFQNVLSRLDDIGAVSFKGQLCITDNDASTAQLIPTVSYVLLIVSLFFQRHVKP